MTTFGPYTAHPIADKFDMLDEHGLAAMADSIMKQGQAIPCVVWGSWLVDGRNRWRACERAGVVPKIERRLFKDEAECGRWIIAVNKDRRHCTPSQLAMICTEPEVLELYREDARERQRESGGDKRSASARSVSANMREPFATFSGQKAIAQSAAAFGVSTRSAESAVRVRQYIDYSGLRWDKITPTNIDGVLDFARRLFVFLEFKSVGSSMPRGQRLLFARLHAAIVRGGTMCVVLIAEHAVDDPRLPILAGGASVVEILDGAVWRTPLRPVTVREAIETYLRRAFPEVL